MVICCQRDLRACLRWNVQSLICRRSLPACGRRASARTCSPIAHLHNTGFTVNVWKCPFSVFLFFLFFFLQTSHICVEITSVEQREVKSRSRRGRCPPKQTHLSSYPSSISLSLHCGYLISCILEAETCLHTLRLNGKDAFSRTKSRFVTSSSFPLKVIFMAQRKRAHKCVKETDFTWTCFPFSFSCSSHTVYLHAPYMWHGLCHSYATVKRIAVSPQDITPACDVNPTEIIKLH